MVNRLLRFLRGFVRVRCEGGLPGRLLSEAMRENIDVFGISERGGVVRFCVAARDYRRFPSLAAKSGCRIRMTGKRGLALSIAKMRYRMQLAVGAAVFCAVFFFCGSRAFTVEVRGDSLIPSNEIMSSLEENGIYPGAPQAGLDVKLIRQRVLLDNERLSWMSINLSFGRAVVELKDKADIPFADNGKQGDALVARYDAVVTKVDISGGTAAVSAGDVVAKGQLLARGNGDANGMSWTANVRGAVWGNARLVYFFSVPRSRYQETPTGRTSVARRLVLTASRGGAESAPPFMQFEALRYREPIALFGVKLPVCFAVTEYAEVARTREAVGPERAQELALERCREYEAQALAGAEILERDIRIEESGDGFAVCVYYTVNTVISEVSRDNSAPEHGAQDVGEGS